MKKIVVITGANSGIGKAAAYTFAAKGYHVVMACRNIAMSEPIRSEMIRKCNNQNIDLIQLDISSKRSIEAFCDIYKSRYSTLDILIHNAGHFKHGERRFQRSVDGAELTFATNLLGPFMMTSLLLDVLTKSASPIVLHACSSSLKYFFDERRTIDFDMHHNPAKPTAKYDSYKIYGDSKLALLMATFKMAGEYHPLGIRVNALMIPATKMSHATINKLKSYWKLLALLQKPFTVATSVIGDAYFSICTSERFKNVSGKLFNKDLQIMTATDQSISFFKSITDSRVYPCYAQDRAAIEKTWTMCNQFVNVPYPTMLP